jgi:hypothetical protein
MRPALASPDAKQRPCLSQAAPRQNAKDSPLAATANVQRKLTVAWDESAVASPTFASALASGRWSVSMAPLSALCCGGLPEQAVAVMSAIAKIAKVASIAMGRLVIADI